MLARPWSGWRAFAGVLFLALSLGLMTGCRVRQELSEGVQLGVTSETLEPSSTFELRFEEAMVGADAVGEAVEPSPLVIQPALPGRFVWLSPHSGVYTPDEPPALGTQYTFELRPGLRKAGGGASVARLWRMLATPGLELTSYGSREASDPALPGPQVLLGFNAAVVPREAAGRLRFRSREGEQVKVRARWATYEEARWFPMAGLWPHSLGGVPTAWKDRFVRVEPGDAVLPLPFVSPRIPADNEVLEHCLIVEPREPLAAGRGWELSVAAGWRAKEGQARLGAEVTVPLPGWEPFEVQQVDGVNGWQDGRRVEVTFSKPIAPDLAASNLLDWFEVRPAVAELDAEREGARAVLRGVFELGRRYTVEVKRGFPAYGGLTLAKGASQEITFEPLAPRLYFPEFSTPQMAGGRREFPLVSVNVESVRVRAKQMDASTLIHGLRGYRSYFREGWRWTRSLEPFEGLDYNLVPGRTVHDRTLSVAGEVDEGVRVGLRWDDVLGEGGAGAVLLSVDRVPTNVVGWMQTPAKEKAERLGVQALVQVTDLGMVWKRSADRVWVNVFSHRTGGMADGATVRLLSDENEVLAEAVADGNGQVDLPVSTNAVWLMAMRGSDLHAIGLREGYLPRYLAGVPYEWEWEGREGRGSAGLRGLLFTDRPVYRPGDTVRAKGVLREWSAGRLGLAGVTGPATFRCTDARGRVVVETNAVVSARGAWDGEWTLPLRPQGEYTIELELGEATLEHRFLVRDYRPRAFEVTLTAKPEYAAGESVEVGVEASYLLGQPLSRAEVRWTLNGEDAGFAPEGFEEFRFGSYVWEEGLGREQGGFGDAGEERYVGGTLLVLRPEVPLNAEAPMVRACELMVEVTDLNQQTLAQQVEWLQHSSEFYLGLRWTGGVVRAGGSLPIEVIAVGADGQPWGSRVNARAKLQRVTWRTVRVESAGNVTGYRSEPELGMVAEGELPTRAVVRVGRGWEVAPGQGEPMLWTVPEAGEYLLEILGEDGQGREVVTALTFHAYGEGAMAWDWENETRIPLVADAERYAPGQTAVVLAKAPFSGTALVTVERDRVLRSYVTNLTGNAPAIRVPIEASDAPNVFVSVLLLRGAEASPRRAPMPEYRVGYCSLGVQSPETRLDVGIEVERADYLPGEEVGLQATVRDGTGGAVGDAEVTLFAVDEGVLGLTGFETPDLFTLMHEEQRLAVDTALSLPSLMEEDPSRMRFQNKGYVAGGGGRMPPRRNFAACAFWSAAMLTDAEGRVRARFAAPDSLTRYRVMAVVHAGSDRFGRGESAFRVNKPLLIEPALPSFARVGDRLLARAVVMNRSGGSGTAEVSVRLDATVQAGSDEWSASEPVVVRRVDLAEGAAAPVDIPLAFVREGTGRWVWSVRWAEPKPAARGGEARDAVESVVKVGLPGAPLRELRMVRVGPAVTNVLAGMSPAVMGATGTVTVRVSGTRRLELGEAVQRLLHYPYGCVEQTASSLLPWVVVRAGGAEAWGLTNRMVDVERTIAEGVNRMFSMQTLFGGLGYWPGATEPERWCSAYGAVVLALAQREGNPVPEEAFQSLLGYLRQQLARPAGSEGGGMGGAAPWNDLCLAAYALALAGEPEASVTEALFNKRSMLSASARAWLALALVESGGPSERVRELLAQRRTLRGGAELDPFSGPESEQAVRLLANVRGRPEAASDEIETLVSGLSEMMRDGHWESTQGNAWAVLALSEYSRRCEAGDGKGGARLGWGGVSEEVSWAEKGKVVERTYPLPGPRPGEGLTVASATDGAVYVEVSADGHSAVVNPPRQDQGYALEREYARVDDEGRLGPATALKVGDRVLVTLRVEVRESALYVVVDDPLPALLEAVHPEFEPAGGRTRAPGVIDWVSDHRELRSDRAVFFCNQLRPGQHEVSYLARVRAAGTVIVPPARVEEMYRPRRFGQTESLRIEAKAR